MAEPRMTSLRNDLIGDFKSESGWAFVCGTLFYFTAALTFISIAAPILPIPNELKSFANLLDPCCKSIELLAVATLGQFTHGFNKRSINTVKEINKLSK